MLDRIKCCRKENLEYFGYFGQVEITTSAYLYYAGQQLMLMLPPVLILFSTVGHEAVFLFVCFFSGK